MSASFGGVAVWQASTQPATV